MGGLEGLLDLKAFPKVGGLADHLDLIAFLTVEDLLVVLLDREAFPMVGDLVGSLVLTASPKEGGLGVHPLVVLHLGEG